MRTYFEKALVLACVDLGMSIILLLGGIGRGIMWSYGWVTYDSLFGLPLSGVMVILGVLAIICLTLGKEIEGFKMTFCSQFFKIALFIYGTRCNVPNPSSAIHGLPDDSWWQVLRSRLFSVCPIALYMIGIMMAIWLPRFSSIQCKFAHQKMIGKTVETGKNGLLKAERRHCCLRGLNACKTH